MTGTAFTQNTFNSYGYNDRSEVVAGEKYLGADIADKTSPVTAYDYDFAYDNIGNRTSSDFYQDNEQKNLSYTSNALNQYTAVTGLPAPTYDADGNMTLMPSSSGDWDLTWNAENRLAATESATTRLEFTYDYQGRRIEKKASIGGAGSWTLQSHEKFIYDGWNLVATLDATDGNAVVKTYTWGLDLSQSAQGAGGVGGLLAVAEHDSTGTETHYATYDANGNISEYLDQTGAIAAHYEYSPFGRTTAATGAKSADFNHRFSTKFFDSETELYYYGYRYYSSELGRWINRDPIEEDGGVSLFLFVSNSPLTLYDSIGLHSNIPSLGLPSPKNILDCTTKCLGQNFFNLVGYKIAKWAKRIKICNRMIPSYCASNGTCKRANIRRINMPQLGQSKAKVCMATCLFKSALRNFPGVDKAIVDAKSGEFDWSLHGDIGFACNSRKGISWWFMIVQEIKNRKGQKTTKKTIIETGECASGGQAWCLCCNKNQ